MSDWTGLPARALALALLAATTLAGCQTTGSGGTDVSCRAFRPIEWSRQDTLGTKHQVRGHNAAYTSLCGRGR